MRGIQWSLGVLACFAMVMSPCVRPSFADEPAANRTFNPDEPAAAPTASPAGQKVAVDLSFVPASAVAAIVLHPQQILTGEMAEMLPVEVITATGLQNIGFDPVQIQEAVVVVSPPQLPPPAELAPATAVPARANEPGFGVILHFSQPYSRRDVFAKLKPMHALVKGDQNKKYALLPGSPPVGIFMPDDHTLVVGTESLLQEMIDAKNVDSKLTQLLRATDCSGTATAVFSVDAMRGLIDQALAHAPPVPPQFADFLKIPKLISSGVIKLDLRAPGELSATLHAADAKSAEELTELIERALVIGRQAALANIAAEAPRSDDPVQQAMQKYMVRITGRTFDSLKPKREGADVRWAAAGMGSPAVSVAVIGILIGLLLPAVQSARGAAQRMQSANNLKQIAIALLNYESAYNKFPAHAIYSKDGKPLLSWRVEMLPYVEEVNPYNEFHRDEPWDSPHNKALISKMPAIFAEPGENPATGLTHYVVPVGKGLMFDGDKQTKITDITDGTSNSIGVLEADNPVIWSKPDDLDVDLHKPLDGLGHLRSTGFYAVFVDGSVHLISGSVDPATMKALFTIAGGEVVNLDAVH